MKINVVALPSCLPLSRPQGDFQDLNLEKSALTERRHAWSHSDLCPVPRLLRGALTCPFTSVLPDTCRCSSFLPGHPSFSQPPSVLNSCLLQGLSGVCLGNSWVGALSPLLGSLPEDSPSSWVPLGPATLRLRVALFATRHPTQAWRAVLSALCVSASSHLDRQCHFSQLSQPCSKGTSSLSYKGLIICCGFCNQIAIKLNLDESLSVFSRL